MERERDIEKWLRGQVEGMGGKFMKFVSPGNDGVPDRLVIMPGGCIWFVELKADGGQLAPIQKWQIEQLDALGARAIVVKGMKEARDFIADLRDEQEALA